MDADMYDHMSLLGSSSPRVERGIALHKMVRLLCSACHRLRSAQTYAIAPLLHVTQTRLATA